MPLSNRGHHLARSEPGRRAQAEPSPDFLSLEATRPWASPRARKSICFCVRPLESLAFLSLKVRGKQHSRRPSPEG